MRVRRRRTWSRLPASPNSATLRRAVLHGKPVRGHFRCLFDCEEDILSGERESGWRLLEELESFLFGRAFARRRGRATIPAGTNDGRPTRCCNASLRSSRCCAQSAAGSPARARTAGAHTAAASKRTATRPRSRSSVRHAPSSSLRRSDAGVAPNAIELHPSLAFRCLSGASTGGVGGSAAAGAGGSSGSAGIRLVHVTSPVRAGSDRLRHGCRLTGADMLDHGRL